jgi:hypothetical protein
VVTSYFKNPAGYIDFVEKPADEETQLRNIDSLLLDNEK